MDDFCDKSLAGVVSQHCQYLFRVTLFKTQIPPVMFPAVLLFTYLSVLLFARLRLLPSTDTDRHNYNDSCSFAQSYKKH